MAHQIETAAFRRVPAWHRLGAVVDTLGSPYDALRTAQIDWTVSTRPIFLAGSSEPIPGHRAVVRDTDGRTLSVVTDDYKVTQQSELARLYADLVEAGHLQMEAAGSLQGGKRVWLLARSPLGAEISRATVYRDRVNLFLLATNCHTAKEKVRIMWTDIRVVCANTVNMALAADSGLFISHRGNMARKLEEARALIDVGAQSFFDRSELYKRMAAWALTPDEAARLVREILQEEESDKPSRAFQSIMGRLDNDVGAMEAGRTLWGLHNAVTSHIDYPYRKRSDDAILTSSWHGTGAQLRARASQVLTAVTQS